MPSMKSVTTNYTTAPVHLEVKELPKPPKQYPTFHGQVSYLLQIDRMEKESQNTTIQSAAAPTRKDLDYDLS